MKINVLHVYLFFSIKYAGGTSDLMYKIAKNQEKTEVKPSILTGNYKIDYDLIKKLPNTDFHILNSYFDKSGFSIMPGLFLFCLKELKKFNVIHMHCFRTFQNLIVFIFAKFYNIPIVMDAHGSVPYFINKPILKRLFDFVVGKRILTSSKILIGESKVGIQEYIDLIPNIEPDKLKILSPPFDTDEFEIKFNKNYLRNKYNIEEKFIIGFLGRIHFIKGLDFLVKAFEVSLKSNKDLRLVIIGSDDGYFDQLNELIKKLDLQDKITFAGFLSGDDKNNALFDCDLVVQCSRLEQGAWAPIEAVLTGTPILVTDGTGSAEDVKRLDAGKVIKFGDANAFNKVIKEMYKNPKPFIKKTKVAASFIKNNLSFNTRINEYKKIYESCISKK